MCGIHDRIPGGNDSFEDGKLLNGDEKNPAGKLCCVLPIVVMGQIC